MDRTTAWYALVALLGGIAVVLAAATLPTATRTERPVQFEGEGNDSGGLLPPPPEDSPASTIDGTIPFLSELLVLLALLTLAALLWYLYHDRRGLFQIVAGVIVIVGLVLLLGPRIPADLSFDAVTQPLGTENETSFGTGDDGDRFITTDPSALSVLLVLLLGVFLVGLIAVLTRQTTASDTDPEPAADVSEDAVAVGRVAGRTADRLEAGTGAENEIYRAWVEMTELFDLSRRETKTPGEFATAAVDAGMDADDVGELTRLFEQIRYSTDTPSEANEQRAIDLFRRIESTYSEDES